MRQQCCWKGLSSRKWSKLAIQGMLLGKLYNWLLILRVVTTLCITLSIKNPNGIQKIFGVNMFCFAASIWIATRTNNSIKGLKDDVNLHISAQAGNTIVRPLTHSGLSFWDMIWSNAEQPPWSSSRWMNPCHVHRGQQLNLWTEICLEVRRAELAVEWRKQHHMKGWATYPVPPCLQN